MEQSEHKQFIGKSPKEYGKKYFEHLLEQYKLYVEMADQVSVRRGQTNRFYISLLSGLLVVLSIITEKNILSSFQNCMLIAVAILGLTLCFLWFVNINSYRQLNSAKFAVIHEIEQHLPYAAFYKEWKVLGKGKKINQYFQLTRVEQFIPFILAIPYLLLLVYFCWD